MRKKLLGTIAALVAGAGGALAQNAPTRPSPIPVNVAPAMNGMTDPSLLPVNRYNEPIAPPLPGMPGMGGPEGMDGGAGGPLPWPPPGPYGQTPYESPDLDDGLMGGGGPVRFYADGGYLLMFPKSQPTNYPLLTTSAPSDLGRVGQPTTSILSGVNNKLNIGTASGFRLNAGIWRREDQRVGIEIGGLYLAPVSYNEYVLGSAGGIPLLARPFVSDVSGLPISLITSSPGTIGNSSALVRATTSVWGAEANGLWNAYRTCPGECRSWNLNFLLGYRYFELSEQLHATNRGTVLQGNTIAYGGVTVGQDTTIEVRDQFVVMNKFHGGQVGFQSQFTSGRWYVGVTGKVGFGLTNQRVDVMGTTSATNPIAGTASTTLGGLFANASNIGSYRQDNFGILTDCNATFGFNFTSWLTGTVGYNFIHLSSVARPGNMYSGRVDPTLVPLSASYGTGSATTNPFSYRQDDFFVHGLNFGLVFRY
jgi:Putative beta barrel porin-7 (BBP7)